MKDSVGGWNRSSARGSGKANTEGNSVRRKPDQSGYLSGRSVGSYDSRELTELREQMKAIGSMQEQERLKLRADELLDNGNDWAAMEEYRHILRMHQNLKLGVSFYGAVWNNLVSALPDSFCSNGQRTVLSMRWNILRTKRSGNRRSWRRS